jgi:hypothetical protein
MAQQSTSGTYNKNKGVGAMTRITLENQDGTYTVEVRGDETLFLPELLQLVVKPVLRAAGFSEDNVDEAIPE